MEEASIALTIKLTGTTETFPISIAASKSVGDLKDLVSLQVETPAERLKLILRGKVLKNESSLSEAGVKDGDVVYMVKSVPSAPAQPQAPTSMATGTAEMTGLMQGLNHFGIMNQASNMMDNLPDLDNLAEQYGMPAPNPEVLRNIMGNPQQRQMMMTMMQQMMSNPQMREFMVNSNPALRDMASRFPGFTDMLGNPAVMQQAMSMMERMGTGNTEGPLSGDSSSFPAPGGSPSVNPANPAPSNAGNQSSNSSLNTSTNPSMNTSTNPSMNPSFNPSMNPSFNPSMNPSFNPSMNPQVPGNQPSGFNAPFNPGNAQGAMPQPGFNQPMQFPFFNPFMGNWGMGQFPNPYAQPPSNPREAYQEQLQKMKELGFINEESNLQALVATGGNVEAAIERILNMLG